ncbi:hypothetical protein Glove_38g63 [Diversispora epigaea]|uniref:C2H2-type domain-containing protein n=1 Tax=Diversispora epigaea TaxID=1348612 RepID=A0A397JFY5_9GLOM|nr:hypothetical protein Glove_38g63 [Diversispora epigaea]
MSVNFKCLYCDRYLSSRNAYSQHVKYCNELKELNTSTEESNNDISDTVSSINEMSLDSDDFSQIEELQSIREENLPPVSEISYQYESDSNYAGDVSLRSEEFKNFDEILSESLQNYTEKSDTNMSNTLQELEPKKLEPKSLTLQDNIEESEVEIKEFPNEAYADLMTLVTKHNLSNKAGNSIIKFFNRHSDLSQSPLPKNIETGRKFMDKMNISQLSYSKHCILVHNNREYFINYRPIKNCIEILLSNSEILQHFIFKYENKKHQGEKSYAEQNSGNWWKYAEASIPSSACILSLILYSDATTTDTLGKSSLHPIYISLGNIPTWRRNKEDAKQLLGYFPILFAKNEKEKTSPEFKKLVRETFHKSLKFLLDPLFENENGIDYKINNRIIWFFPKISTIIGDWPEACTYSLIYKSASSNFPCHFCLVQKNDLIDTMQDQIILRNHENMMEHFNNNTGHSVSLEPVENYFWNIPNLNIYAATVPDRMHHLDLGLYHYQIEFTKGILGRSSIDKMNERIGAIPRYPGLKIFSKGLQSIARLTASEHRDLMKMMVFVVDGLLSDDLSEVYVKWNEMYILSRLEIFKESDLEKFQKAINEWADLFVILFRKKSDSKMKFPKFHSWIFHIVDTIREYGAINGYTTETYESLHKSYVKTPYRLSNKKGIEEQIMKTIRRKAIIKRRVTEELHKTPTTLIYTSKLFEFKLLEASIFFEQQKKNPDLTENMIKGFAKFLECLDLFFDMLDIISAEDCRIKIFGSVTLKNINILRATNKFQNRPWFSNIAIAMDDAELFEYQSDNRTCYAQTLLITEVILPNKSPFHLALVQWYDFKSKKTPFVYDCPLLKLVEIYNFIEIEAIEEIVHIVPRFDTKDEYFVNKFIF